MRKRQISSAKHVLRDGYAVVAKEGTGQGRGGRMKETGIPHQVTTETHLLGKYISALCDQYLEYYRRLSP